MTQILWDESALTKDHDRKNFDCGNSDLNTYLHRTAWKSHESGGAKCFVATRTDAPKLILGYYTLSPASVEFSRAPALAKKIFVRDNVPMFRLGRLAVDQNVRGRGLGGALLLRAALRCIRVASEVGGVALLIEAKNETAARWYESYGAMALDDAPMTLVLPLATVVAAVGEGG